MQSKNQIFTLLDWLFQFVLSFPIWAWVVVGFLLLFLQLVAWRMARFSHPAAPRWSLVIRHAIHPLLLWPTFLSIASLVFGWLLLLVLGNHFGVFTQIWEAVRFHLIATGAGAGTGLVVGALFYYWLIPGWETPASSAADADASIAQLRGYDPERYFRA